MLFSAPLQKRVMLQQTTLFHQLKTSMVPPVAVSPQMRRIMRPRGRTIRKLPFVERNIAPGKHGFSFEFWRSATRAARK